MEALKKPFTVGCNHLLKNVDLLVRELYYCIVLTEWTAITSTKLVAGGLNSS